jgi:hypothetical protein
VSAPAAGDADALGAALAAQGWACSVEARAGLALVTVTADELRRFVAPGEREAVLVLAKALGFTHVAVEPADRSTGRAAVLRA